MSYILYNTALDRLLKRRLDGCAIKLHYRSDRESAICRKNGVLARPSDTGSVIDRFSFQIGLIQPNNGSVVRSARHFGLFGLNSGTTVRSRLYDRYFYGPRLFD